MIKAIIIDDEIHCIERLKKILLNHFSMSIQLVGTYKTVSGGKKAIEILNPDLIFLDIQLKSQSGFDLLNEIGKVNIHVIFTTAFEEYAIKAFKFNAIDYLLKPIDPSELADAIVRLQGEMKKNQQSEKFEILFKSLCEEKKSNKKIAVPTMNGLVILNISDIIRCQSDVNYTYIFLESGEKMMVSKSLKEFELLLKDYQFYRVHNSHLVNLDFIKSYFKGKGGYLELLDGSSVEVSSRRKSGLLVKLNKG
ncbi:LytTR family DNA-binding domain-containing protein [Echinicola jeungdonensis]|uniref:LytR/AlgR family response regulator transcription factor n=1 Tax=Echinicola jeungdonensis TaxID=709343 RepID=A0ABV5J159_9BACT|nr:LytTR family DNA-binding domain-containing protein [Echinicola jeungdonensis]MDN3671137.1 LytTR family DNA-binding domain-containing protein [Echinicola jeungdonensis]